MDLRGYYLLALFIFGALTGSYYLIGNQIVVIKNIDLQVIDYLIGVWALAVTLTTSIMAISGGNRSVLRSKKSIVFKLGAMTLYMLCAVWMVIEVYESVAGSSAWHFSRVATIAIALFLISSYLSGKIDFSDSKSKVGAE